jgi:uncharacterized lipoprotein YddW (UPF0748 family)
MLPLVFAALFASDTLRLPAVPREFRGVWVATVGNIDWPSRPGLPTELQQEELLTLLDRAQALRLNAVIFQVRPSGDALYESEIEPWSEYLTGKQGLAPHPKWDPLAFVIREAHARGLELHAWFNPYRARQSLRQDFSPMHIARRIPTVVKDYGTNQWMDPGDERVRDHTRRVILDVVRRYDVDGVHIDDYFYPYPERDRYERIIPFPDDFTYSQYQIGGGMLERDAWRRENVDKLVEAIGKDVHAAKPWVKFGISPFGIWRPGEPEGVMGFDSYTWLFADARRWVREGWADYFAPQLYWTVNAREQNYSQLLRWWGEQNLFGKHIWPGNFTSRVGTMREWTSSELVQQIIATRADRTATGNIHFSMNVFMKNRSGIGDVLTSRVYNVPALIPESPWLHGEAPRSPRARFAPDGASRIQACLGDTTLVPPRWWVLYVKRDSAWTFRVLPGGVRQMALGALRATDSVALSAVDRTGRQGGATVATKVAKC